MPSRPESEAVEPVEEKPRHPEAVDHPSEVCDLCHDFMDRTKEVLVMASKDLEGDDAAPLCSMCGTDIAKLHKKGYKRIKGFIDATGLSLVPHKPPNSDELVTMRVQGSA